MFYAFIQVLRGHCYYNPQTGEMRTTCFPELATLAKECGVSRATICRLIQRDAEGRFINRSLERFVKIIPRRRYDPEHEREVQTSNLYLVAMDDPTIPEDDHLVAEKEAELAALLAEEQAREERATTAKAAAGTPRTESQNETLRAVSNCDSQSRLKMRRENRTLNATSNIGTHRSDSKEWWGAQTIRRTSPSSTTFSSHQEQQRNEETWREEESRWSETEYDRIVSSNEKEEVPPAARLSSKQSENRAPSERDALLERADEVAGGVIYSLLSDLGDTNAGVGTRIILEALVAAGAPVEKMRDLAYLGRARVKRFQARGGRIHTTPAGFYTNVMRNLAKEARRQQWDTKKLEEKDRRNHERAIEAAERKRQQQMGYHYR